MTTADGRLLGGKKLWPLMVVAGLAILLLPAVQLQVFRLFNGVFQDLQLDAGYLWVGPWGATFEDLTLKDSASGLSANVGQGNVDLAFWSSLAGWRFDIESAVLEGVALELALPEWRVRGDTIPAETDEAEAPFRGFAPAARIPRWLSVRQFSAAGNLRLTGGDDLEFVSSWTLDASGWRAASAASLNLASTTDARRLGETLATAQIGAGINADLDSSSRIVNLAAAADIDPLVDLPGLHATADLQIDEFQETYRLALIGEAGRNLAHLDGVYLDSGELKANWDADLPPGALARFARGRAVADLVGHMTGELLADLAIPSAQIQSSVALTGSGWEAFDPRLADIGTLAFDFDFIGALKPGQIDASVLDLRISSIARGEMLRVNSLQALRYRSDGWLVEPQVWGEPALRIRAYDMPLRWLRRLGLSEKFEGGQFSGAIELVRHETRRTELIVLDPLRVVDLQLVPVTDVMPASFDLKLIPRATLGDGVLEGEIEELSITADTGLEFVFRGQGRTSQSDWPVSTLTGQVSMRVPRLTNLIPQLDQVHGNTRLQFDFDTLVLMIETAAVNATTATGKDLLVADLSSQQPLRVALPDFVPDWDALDAQSASVRFEQVPMDWLSAYAPELEFRGGRLSGRLNASVTAGQGLTLGSDTPLVIENVLPLYRGRPARDTWTVRVTPKLQLRTAVSTLLLDDILVETATGNTLHADARIEAPAGGESLAMGFTLNADVAASAARHGARVAGLKWRQDGELRPESGSYRLRELAIQVTDTNGVNIVQLESLRPFSVTAQPFRIDTEGEAGDIVKVEITPLALDQLLPNLLGLELEGSLPQGQFFGRADANGSLVLTTDDSLVFQDVSVRWKGAPLLDRVTTSVDYELAYSAEGFEARSVEVVATDALGRDVLRSTSDVVAPLNQRQLLQSARVNVTADLRALTSQPALTGMPRFADGELELSFNVAHHTSSELEFAAILREAATDQGELPAADVRVELAGAWGEQVRLAMPIRLESETFGVSAVRLEGTLARDRAGMFAFDAYLQGDTVAVSDVERLLALFDPPASAADDADLSGGIKPLSEEALTAIARLRAERHETPVWTEQLTGQVTIDIGALASPSLRVEDVRARLDVIPHEVRLTDVHAGLLGADLSSDARIQFNAANPKPYSLYFESEVPEFEIGTIFRAVAPDTAPTTEGRFALKTSLTGVGLNPLDLALSSLGEFRLIGHDGIFRGLAAHAGTGSTAARVIGILTFSRELKAVARLLDGLGEIRFEQAELKLERARPDEIEITRLAVLSPQFQIEGSGKLALAPQQALVLSPMAMSAQLAARGDIAVIFDAIGLLAADVDSAGFQKLDRVVNVGGTPLQPDTSEFWDILEEAGNNARGIFGVGLRALNRRLESTAEGAPSQR